LVIGAVTQTACTFFRVHVENRGQAPSARRQLLFAPLFLLEVFGAHPLLSLSRLRDSA
jgi:hypothetical protein